ncbi:MAG: beta family protein [Pyrinomonadaceae bacterium]|nr:beta family protein [Pyrinomonadaceae bacterium]MBP6212714.1 beta family protein [Pyrinomonadaceae bacterium]
MFDHTFYVPILRRRSAELAALTNTLAEDLKQIRPLFEMCEQILPDERRSALASVENSAYFWGVIRSIAAAYGRNPYFIDFGSVEGLFSNQNGQHPLETYFDLLDFHMLPGVPVTGMNRPESYQTAIEKITSQYGVGICLRVGEQEIRNPSFVPLLQLVLRRFRLAPANVDLLVDLKQKTDITPSLEEICGRIPMLGDWRTFTVACGAFPQFLSQLEKNAEHELPRHDWKHWKDAVSSARKLPRIPTYSDYTIQFPKTPAPLDFLPNVSASIRYASPEHWVVMRGEGLRNENGAKFEQYWGQANSLMFRDEYSGADFSYGDQYVATIGLQTTKTGSPATWLKAGINRHLTLTVRQIGLLLASESARTESFGRLSRPPLQTIWNRSRLVLPDSYAQGYLFPPE